MNDICGQILGYDEHGDPDPSSDCKQKVKNFVPGIGCNVCANCAINYLQDGFAVHPLHDPEFYTFNVLFFDQEKRSSRLHSSHTTLEGAKLEIETNFAKYGAKVLDNMDWYEPQADIYRLSGIDSSVFDPPSYGSGKMAHTGWLIVKTVLKL